VSVEPGLNEAVVLGLAVEEVYQVDEDEYH